MYFSDHHSEISRSYSLSFGRKHENVPILLITIVTTMKNYNHPLFELQLQFIFRSVFGYTAKLLFHQSPTRHSDYTVTTTVTMLSLFSSPRHRDHWTVTTSDTYVIRYPLPWGLCRNLSTRHLVGNCQSLHGNTLDTCYTQSLCRNQGGTVKPHIMGMTHKDLVIIL